MKNLNSSLIDANRVTIAKSLAISFKILVSICKPHNNEFSKQISLKVVLPCIIFFV